MIEINVNKTDTHAGGFVALTSGMVNVVSVPVISALGRKIKEIDATGVGKEELCPIM